MEIKMYFGLSGAMKGATIRSDLKKNESADVMYSAIKPWKSYQFGIFNGLTEYNDLNYSILHLVRLRDFMERNLHPNQKDLLIIERGITDSLFYRFYNDEFQLGTGGEIDEKLVEEAVKQEELLLLPSFLKITKVLLIQNDKDFVRDVVLREKYRNKTFKNDPEFYFDQQKKYIGFTKKYNQIDQEIVVNNAEDYVENVLGENWES
jgi:hypothetical protein